MKQSVGSSRLVSVLRYFARDFGAFLPYYQMYRYCLGSLGWEGCQKEDAPMPAMCPGAGCLIAGSLRSKAT